MADFSDETKTQRVSITRNYAQQNDRRRLLTPVDDVSRLKRCKALCPCEERDRRRRQRCGSGQVPYDNGRPEASPPQQAERGISNLKQVSNFTIQGVKTY